MPALVRVALCVGASISGLVDNPLPQFFSKVCVCRLQVRVHPGTCCDVKALARHLAGKYWP